MNHWSHHARKWDLLGPPLRPSPEDTAAMRGLPRGVGSVTALLGATPELANLADLAVDLSAVMLHAILPPNTAAPIVANWLALPIADGALDRAIGDGCLTTLRYPDQYVAFADELARVVKPGGVLALRLFASPDVAEPIVVGRSMHALKWRIAMDLAERGDRNVAVTAIREAFVAQFPDRDALPWPRAVTDMIDGYLGSDVAYSYPTVAETDAVLATRFEREQVIVGTYELAARCPTVVYRRRG